MTSSLDKTKTRYKILKAIVDHDLTHNYGISLDEISDNLCLSGRPAAHYHVNILREEGFVKRESLSKRNLRATAKGKFLIDILEGN